MCHTHVQWRNGPLVYQQQIQLLSTYTFLSAYLKGNFFAIMFGQLHCQSNWHNAVLVWFAFETVCGCRELGRLFDFFLYP